MWERMVASPPMLMAEPYGSKLSQSPGSWTRGLHHVKHNFARQLDDDGEGRAGGEACMIGSGSGGGLGECVYDVIG